MDFSVAELGSYCATATYKIWQSNANGPVIFLSIIKRKNSLLLNLSRVYKRLRTSAALDKFNNKPKKHLKSKEKIKFESNLNKRQSLNYTPRV